MYRILVIDDDASIRAVLGRILKPADYAVSFACDLNGAWRACLSDKPDLILLDIHFPEGSGMDLCRRIKAEPELRHIPVFILTGEAIVTEDRVKGLQSGAEDYIIKPFAGQELLARIERTIKFHYERV